jgi:glycine cleavage system H protein
MATAPFLHVMQCSTTFVRPAHQRHVPWFILEALLAQNHRLRVMPDGPLGLGKIVASPFDGKRADQACEETVMTVILVLATIIIFLAIDYVRNGRRVRQPAAQREQEIALAPKVEPSFVSGFDVRENLSYHPGHTWALQESQTFVRIGLDDFAARLIGKAESILLPKRGQWIRQGQKIVTVLRDGSKAELVSPIEGEVTKVNEVLLSDPSLPCRDPYGDGWLLGVVSPDSHTNFRNLLGGGLARRWMEDAASRLRAKLPAAVGAVAQDGGVAVDDLTAHLPNQAWVELTHEFFLT